LRQSKSWLIAAFLLILLPACRAQDSAAPAQNYDFTPGVNVIFEDDLAAAPTGEFPAKWEQQKGQAAAAMVAGKHVMTLIADGTQVTPRMTAAHYLPASFTLEFDLYLKKDSNALILMFNDGEDSKVQIGFDAGSILFNGPSDVTATYNIPEGQANENFVEHWHHVALAVNSGQMKIYLDKVRALTVPDIHSAPFNVSFYGDGQTGIPVVFTGVRVASGGGMNMVGKKFTDAKIVTHAINFAVNSAAITPDSSGEIARIAGILRDNPQLRFEVGGHTDNSGTAARNMTLSLQRAESVKAALVAAGIDGSRLTTKGYGDTVPLSPNTTDAGKANNRRVELTRLN
jgi:outer membrane protein OmpA-like peptidoglycan-associated protein